MNLRMLNFSRVAALLLFGLCFGVGLGAAPAAACGYGCYAPVRVVVQPYYYQSCSCCGCGASSYGYGYAAPYAAYAAGYDDYDDAVVVAPRYYAPRWRARYWGPRRGIGVRY
jgi:hypothetical protein